MVGRKVVNLREMFVVETRKSDAFRSRLRGAGQWWVTW